MLEDADQGEGLASLVAELRWRKDQTAKRHDAGPSRPRLLSAHPMRFQRRGGRKRIVAPDCIELIRQPVPARQRHGQGDRPCLSASTWPGATKPARFARPSWQGAAEQARRAGVVQCPASGSARARASEQRASWCLRIGMAMKLRPSSSSSRCCGVALNALSLPNPSKK